MLCSLALSVKSILMQRVAKKYVDHFLMLKLVDLFNSMDPRKRVLEINVASSLWEVHDALTFYQKSSLKDHIIYKKKIHTWTHKDVMSFIAHKGNVTKQQNNYKNDLTIMMTISVHAPFVSTSRPSVEPGIL
ncbi:hypothetical protein P3S68_021973 [Capsicum galapagoense]